MLEKLRKLVGYDPDGVRTLPPPGRRENAPDVNLDASREMFAYTGPGLPIEMWVEISAYLEDKDMVRLALTCRTLYEAVKEKIEEAKEFHLIIKANMPFMDHIFKHTNLCRFMGREEDKGLYSGNAIAVDSKGEIVAFGKDIKYALTRVWLSFLTEDGTKRIDPQYGDNYLGLLERRLESEVSSVFFQKRSLTFFQMVPLSDNKVSFVLMQDIKRKKVNYPLPKQNNRDKIERMMAKLAEEYVHDPKRLDKNKRKCIVM